MTREEAIERRDRIRYNLLNLDDKAAVDVAFDALREQPQWIGVDDGLPKNGTSVIVCSKYRYGPPIVGSTVFG